MIFILLIFMILLYLIKFNILILAIKKNKNIESYFKLDN